MAGRQGVSQKLDRAFGLVLRSEFDVEGPIVLHRVIVPNSSQDGAVTVRYRHLEATGQGAAANNLGGVRRGGRCILASAMLSAIASGCGTGSNGAIVQGAGSASQSPYAETDPRGYPTCSPIPIATVSPGPDGGTTYFWANGGRHSDPPSGFSPLHASAKQLQEFGFPPRPKGGPALKNWKQVMGHWHGYSSPAPLQQCPENAG
jgi:hypothetical protein